MTAAPVRKRRPGHPAPAGQPAGRASETPGAAALGASAAAEVAGSGATGSAVPDEELAPRLRTAILRLHRRLRQQSLAGISPAQASTLGSVNRLGSPTLGELAAAEQVQPPTMTRIVAQLEGLGLATRLTDAADRRVVRVTVTESGRSTIEHIRELERGFLASRLANLSPEEQAAAPDLVALLEHILTGDSRPAAGQAGSAP